jgi:5'-nucleotidase
MSSSEKKTAKTTNPQTILLTNDDGAHAIGIKQLHEALARWAQVTIVAPDAERSGVGHAFTFNKPLHFEKKRISDAIVGYTVSGTPVDCVKIAISVILPKRPALVVAGLNIGENSGLSAFYSGTVAAAREGAFWDIPAVAFSICEGGERYLKEYAEIALSILKGIFSIERRRKNHRVYYNVNFPACAPRQSKGTTITAQSLAFFDDRYKTIDVETHHTKKGFVIYGEKKDIERSNVFDSRALMNHYITITPLCFDATAADMVPALRVLEKRLSHKG